MENVSKTLTKTLIAKHGTFCKFNRYFGTECVQSKN